MLIVSQHSLSLVRLGQQDFIGKIKQIYPVYGSTYLLHLKPDPDDKYHQLFHLDEHSNLLWTKAFKKDLGTLIDVINQQKILIASYNKVENSKSETEYKIQIVDIKNSYKMVSTKIRRRKQKFLLHTYFLSKCGQQICFLQYQKSNVSSILCHVYKLSSLEMICRPLQYHCQIAQLYILQRPLMGCIGFNNLKKISKEYYQKDIQKVVQKKKNNEEQNQNLLKIEEINDIPLNEGNQQDNQTTAGSIFQTNPVNHINKFFPNNPKRSQPQKDTIILPQKNISYYQIEFNFIQCKFETIKFRQHKYKCQFKDLIKQNSILNFRNIMTKSQKQMILCFQERNKDITHLHFFNLNLDKSHDFLDYIGFFAMNQQPTSIFSQSFPQIQKYYAINDKILIVSKFQRKKQYYCLWLQENENDKMIMKKREELSSSNFEALEIFSFLRDDGNFTTIYEYDGELKIKLVKYAEMRDIYLHSLLHLNEDFDDDLLSDVMEMI